MPSAGLGLCKRLGENLFASGCLCFFCLPIPEDFLQLQVAGLRKSQRAVHTFMSFFFFHYSVI